MLTRRSFLASFALDACAARRLAPGPRRRRAHAPSVTFVLANDIYQMGEQPMPDGKRAAASRGSPPW